MRRVVASYRSHRDAEGAVDYLVSKVLPHHATRAGTVAACEASLRRLRVDHLDIYLLHWRGPVPLAETVAAFEQLTSAGLIGGWGASNRPRPTGHGSSPIEQGRLLRHPVLQAVAERLAMTPAQVALAWVLRLDGVAAIPKAATREHVIANRAALDLRLSPSDLAQLDRAFAPFRGPRPLAML